MNPLQRAEFERLLDTHLDASLDSRRYAMSEGHYHMDKLKHVRDTRCDLIAWVERATSDESEGKQS